MYDVARVHIDRALDERMTRIRRRHVDDAVKVLQAQGWTIETLGPRIRQHLDERRKLDPDTRAELENSLLSSTTLPDEESRIRGQVTALLAHHLNALLDELKETTPLVPRSRQTMWTKISTIPRMRTTSWSATMQARQLMKADPIGCRGALTTIMSAWRRSSRRIAISRPCLLTTWLEEWLEDRPQERGTSPGRSCDLPGLSLVAGAGFEPATFGL